MTLGCERAVPRRFRWKRSLVLLHKHLDLKFTTILMDFHSSEIMF